MVDSKENYKFDLAVKGLTSDLDSCMFSLPTKVRKGNKNKSLPFSLLVTVSIDRADWK